MGFLVDQLTAGAPCSGGSWASGARPAGGCIVGGSLCGAAAARGRRARRERAPARCSELLHGHQPCAITGAGGQHRGGRNGSAEGMPPGTCFTHSQSVLPSCIGGRIGQRNPFAGPVAAQLWTPAARGSMRSNWGDVPRYRRGKANAWTELTRPRLTRRADLAHNGGHEAQAAHTRRQSVRHYHYFELAIIAGARRASLPKS